MNNLYEGAAQKILNVIRNGNSIQHVYQVVDCLTFNHVSIKFYNEYQRRLARLGFERIMDIEDVTLRSMKPDPRTFLRILGNPKLGINAAIYHVAPKFPWPIVMWVASFPLKIYEFQSNYSNDITLETSISSPKISNSYPENVFKQFYPKMALEKLFENHMRKTEEILKENPGTELDYIDSFDKFIENDKKQFLIRKNHLIKIGWVTKEYLYKQVGNNKESAEKIYQEIQRILEEEKSKNNTDEGRQAMTGLNRNAVLPATCGPVKHFEGRTMFNLFKKKVPNQTSLAIRDTLFGDMPFDQWATINETIEPWKSFAAAKKALDNSDKKSCIDILKDIANRKDLESRQYIQAWYFLKQLGSMPPQDISKKLYGVIVEVGMDKGLDILAGYSDLTARYYNFSGAGVVWEKPDNRLDLPIQNLLNAANVVVAKIGPWEESRPPQPIKGNIRINMLTPSGLHFGQGPFQTLTSDEMGGPVVQAATILMQEMIKLSKNA